MSGVDGNPVSSSSTSISSFSPLFVRCFSLLLSECKHRSSLLRCGLSLAVSKFFAEASPQDSKEILSQIASLALNENKPSSSSETKLSSSSSAEEPRQKDSSGSGGSSSYPSCSSSDKRDGKEKSSNLILGLSDRCSEIELKGVLASDKQLVTQVSATAGICLCSLLLHVPVHPSMDSKVLCLIQRVFLRMVSHPDVLAGACGWRGLCRVAGTALSSDLVSKRKHAYDNERRKRRKQREHQGEDNTGKELAMETEEEQEGGLAGKEEMLGGQLPETPLPSEKENRTTDHEKTDRPTEGNKGNIAAGKEEEKYPLFSELLRSLLQAMTVQGRDFQVHHLQMQGFKAPQSSSSSGGENKKKEEDDDKGRSRLYGLNLDNDAAVARVKLLRQLLTVARELNNPPLVYVLLDQPQGEQALFLHHRIFIESLDLLKGITTKSSSSSSFSSKSAGTTLPSNMLYDLTALEKYVDEEEDDAEGPDVSLSGEDPPAEGDDSEQDDDGEELEDQDRTSLAKHTAGQLSERREQRKEGEGGGPWRDKELEDKTGEPCKTGYYSMPGHATEIWTAEAGRILLDLACSETNRATRNVKYALAVYLHHRNAGLRQVALLTCQSVFGFSSLADLLQKSLVDRSEKCSQENRSPQLTPERQSQESEKIVQEEKDRAKEGDQEKDGEYAVKNGEEKNEVWLGLAKSFLLSLQGAEPLRREAACKGGSLLFKCKAGKVEERVRYKTGEGGIQSRTHRCT